MGGSTVEASTQSFPAAHSSGRGRGGFWLRLAGLPLLAGVGVYLGLGAYIANRVSRPIRQTLHTTPAEFGLAYENVAFTSTVDNIPLRGWLIGARDAKTIIFVHSKDGIRDERTMGLPEIATAFVRRNYAVLTFDLRAHGESGGDHFTLGQLETRDVVGAVRFLQSRGRTCIGAIGWSLGAATLLNAAPDLPEIQAIVADSAFANLAVLLDPTLPQNAHLPGWFNPGIYLMARVLYRCDVRRNNPEHVMPRLGSRPVLLIHGMNDTLIPVAHAYRLQQAGAANPHLQLWVAPAAEHVRAFRVYPDEYLQRVFAFFDQNLP